MAEGDNRAIIQSKIILICFAQRGENILRRDVEEYLTEFVQEKEKEK